MRFPSIDRAVDGARVALRRFPLVIASGLLTAAAGIALVQGADEDASLRIAATASLGLPLFTALTLFARRRGLSEGAAWGVRSLGVLLLALWYWRWGVWADEILPVRYLHLSAGLHFFVAVVAYMQVGEDNGFWQFNRELFLRFLTGVVYSMVLFAGLSGAIAAVDNLFGIDVDGEAYGNLWMIVAFVFNTWFFAAGVPIDFDELDRDERYPGGLRAFSQYVVLPLVAVYMLILTSYLVRVLVTREWPSGWIGYLVSALAALGILSLLLVHPLRDRDGHGWIDRYARSFWIAILPSVAMLLMAVWKRVNQYGITEPRYLLSILALWLAGVAGFYAITRSRNIKIIPGSLAAIAFFSFVGPWSAYSTSMRSQLARLSDALEQHGVLVAGRAEATSADVPEDERREITGALSYLIQFHGTGAIDGWFPGGVASIDTIGIGTRPSNLSLQRATLIMRHLGLEPVSGADRGDIEYRYYSAGYPRPPLDVAGFEWAFTGVTINGFSPTIDDAVFAFALNRDTRAFVVTLDGEEVIRRPLADLLERARRNTDMPGVSNVPADSLRVDAEGNGWAVRLYLYQFTEDMRSEPSSVTAAMGDILLRRVTAAGADEVP